MDKFSSEEIDILRHDYGRKCLDWSENRSVCLSNELYNKLVKWTVPPNFYPCDTLPEDIQKNNFFIAKTPETEYLVNTEGFSYSRYISKIIVFDNNTNYSDYEFSLLKHYNGRHMSNWNDIKTYIDPVHITDELYNKLPKLDVKKIPLKSELPKDFKEVFFIAIYDDMKFLVNTEGFTYSRYAVPL